MISTHNIVNQSNVFVSNQKYLNWFAFFCVFPLIKIGGISITFYIFLIIAYNFLKRKKKLFKITQVTDIFFLLFMFFFMMAWALAEEILRDRSIFSIIKLMIQYFYWFVIALFIKTWIYDFDFYELSRSFFFATVISVIYYVTVNPFYQVFFPNSFAYCMVTAMPLAFYYVIKRFSFLAVLLIISGIVLAVLSAGSRTGVALIMMEFLLLLSLGSKQMKYVAIVVSGLLIPFLLILFISLNQSSVESIRYTVADVVDGYSPKIANTLRMQDNIFERDKSWLIRELMVQKGQWIFTEHPFFGVGPGNFHHFSVPLDISGVSKWLHRSEKSYNKTSSQNSYLMILAEDGIFALASILVLFIIIIWKGFYYVKTFRDNAEIYIYIPFIALLIYSLILVTTMGALFWFLLGLAMTLTQRKKQLI